MERELPVQRSLAYMPVNVDIPIIVRAPKLIRRFEAIKKQEAGTLAAAGA
jgi:hypothetical protein